MLESLAIADAETRNDAPLAPRQQEREPDRIETAAAIARKFGWKRILFFGGTAVAAIAFLVPGLLRDSQPISTQPREQRFDPALAIQGSDRVDSDAWLHNVAVFLDDQEQKAVNLSAQHYLQVANTYRTEDPSNTSCRASQEECLASFLENRAAELEQLWNQPGDRVWVEVSKEEAVVLVAHRSKGILSASQSATIPVVELDVALLAHQLKETASGIRNRKNFEAEAYRIMQEQSHER